MTTRAEWLEKMSGKRAEKTEITKLDPADVVTTEEAARLLAPFIKPLPSFETVLLSEKAAA